jgi:hypothetical protein
MEKNNEETVFMVLLTLCVVTLVFKCMNMKATNLEAGIKLLCKR